MSDTLATIASPAAAAPAQAPSAPQPAAAPAPAVKVTPGSKAWAEMTPEQRHDQLRGPPNPRAVGHSPARDQREQAAARASGEAPPVAVDPQNPPAETGSTDKVKIGRFETTEAEIAQMLDRQAADDLRKATIPPTADAYELKLSPDAKLPGGLEFRFDGNDPSMVAARNWAHSKGLDQSAFSEMLTMYASHVAQQETTLTERARAEIAKAGPNGPQRVDAIGKWIRGEVGDADAKPILATIVTDSHLRFYEKLQQKITAQGAASFSQSHRVAPDTNEIPGFDRMSFEQQRYAQDQLAARRR
jgi:hypothetical protein